MNKFVVFLVISALIGSCREKNFTRVYRERTIIRNGVTVKGRISDDTLYNGRILFYKSDTLIASRDFINGVANGKHITYYANGKISKIVSEAEGKADGSTLRFSTAGVLTRDQNYFNGRLVGPQLYYDSAGKPWYFEFINLQNQTICQVDYSASKRPIVKGDLLYSVFSRPQPDSASTVRVLIYMVHPPKFRCDYNVCTVSNNKGDDLQEIEEITSSSIYFEKDFSASKDRKFCVKLNLFDSVTSSEKVFLNIFDE